MTHYDAGNSLSCGLMDVEKGEIKYTYTRHEFLDLGRGHGRVHRILVFQFFYMFMFFFFLYKKLVKRKKKVFREIAHFVYRNLLMVKFNCSQM